MKKKKKKHKQFNKLFLKIYNLPFALGSLKSEPVYKLPPPFQSRIAQYILEMSTSYIILSCFNQSTTNSESGRLTIEFLLRKIIQHMENKSQKGIKTAKSRTEGEMCNRYKRIVPNLTSVIAFFPEEIHGCHNSRQILWTRALPGLLQRLTRHIAHYLQAKPDMDIAFLEVK